MSRVFLSASVAALLLGGCVHDLPKTAAPKHHYVAKATPKPAVTTPAVAPTPKQTFKQRWLRKFFRDRAVAK